MLSIQIGVTHLISDRLRVNRASRFPAGGSIFLFKNKYQLTKDTIMHYCIFYVVVTDYHRPIIIIIS